MKKTLRKSFFGKALGAVTLALLGMTLLLAGCENAVTNPESVTTGVSIPQLPAPGNVRAVAYDGIVFVSWDVVKDATGYNVYRRDSETGAVFVGSAWNVSTAAPTSFIDTVSFTNPLVNGRSYTYTVVALSGQSTGDDYSSTGMSPYGGDAQTLVLNSVASAAVGAKVPDRATYTIPAPTALETSIVRGGSFGSDALEQVLVVWKAELNAKYDVSYTFGAGDVAYTYYLNANNIDGAGSELGSVKFPLVGGSTKITVGPYFTGGRDFYKTGAPITKELNESLSTLPVVSLSGTPARDGPNVVIKWNEVTGAASGAAGYAVYKAEFERATSTNYDDDYGLTANIAIKSNWASVPITAAVLSGTTYTAVDYGVPLDKDYVYLIIAQNGTIKSNPTRFFIGKDTLATAPSTWTITPVDNNTKVQVAFPVETGKTYALARTVVTFTDDAIANTVTDTTTPATIGDWTPVTATVSDNPAYKVFIDTPAKRSFYQYRLNVTESGVTKSYYKNLYTAPFAGTVNSAFASYQGVASSSTIYKAITLKFNFTASDTDLFFNVYRAIWDNTANGVTTTYAKITATPVAITQAIIDYGWDDTATTLTVGTYYSYRFEVLSSASATTAIKNTSTGTLEGHALPATADTALSSALYSIAFTKGSSDDSSANLTIRFGSSTPRSVLQGAVIYAREQLTGGVEGVRLPLTPTISVQTGVRNQSITSGALPANSLYYDLGVKAFPRATYTVSGTNVRTYRIYTESSTGADSTAYLTVTVTSNDATEVATAISNDYSASETVTFNW
jgi:hypothetical protein